MLNLRRGFAPILAAALALAPAAAGSALASGPATDDAYVVNEDETLVVKAPGVLDNDDLVDGTKCVTGVNVEGLSGDLGDSGNTGWRTDGWFTFTPWTEWDGETSFAYGMRSLVDGQCIGQAAGQARVQITVRPVNDAPLAVLVDTCENGVTVREDSGAFTDPGHCAEVHNWGEDEVQAIEKWVVTTDHPELFSSDPSISTFQDSFGLLRFTPAANAHGSARVTVRVRDDGGTARGGVDLGPPLTFTITILGVTDPTPVPSNDPMPTESAAASAEPSESAAAPATAAPTESAPAGVPGDPTGSQGPASGTILLVLIIGALAIGGGILAPRLLRRPPGPA